MSTKALEQVKEMLPEGKIVEKRKIPEIKKRLREVLANIEDENERSDIINHISSREYESDDERADLLSEINTKAYSLDGVESGIDDKLSKAILNGYRMVVEKDLEEKLGEPYKNLSDEVKNNLKIVLWYETQKHFTLSGMMSVGLNGVKSSIKSTVDSISKFEIPNTASPQEKKASGQAFTQKLEEFKTVVSSISEGLFLPIKDVLEYGEKEKLLGDAKFRSVLSSPKIMSKLITEKKVSVDGVLIDVSKEPKVIEISQEIPNISKEQQVFLHTVTKESSKVGPTLKGYTSLGEKVRTFADTLGMGGDLQGFLDTINQYFPSIGYFLTLIFGGGLKKMIDSLEAPSFSGDSPEKKSIGLLIGFLQSEQGKKVDETQLILFKEIDTKKMGPFLEFVKKDLKLSGEMKNPDFWPYLITGKNARGETIGEEFSKNKKLVALKSYFDGAIQSEKQEDFLANLSRIQDSAEMKSLLTAEQTEQQPKIELLKRAISEATSFPIIYKYSESGVENTMSISYVNGELSIGDRKFSAKSIVSDKIDLVALNIGFIDNLSIQENKISARIKIQKSIAESRLKSVSQEVIPGDDVYVFVKTEIKADSLANIIFSLMGNDSHTFEQIVGKGSEAPKFEVTISKIS